MSKPLEEVCILLRSPFVINFISLSSCLLLMTGCCFLQGRLIAQSVFWGGVIFLIPSLYFTYYAFRFNAAKQLQQTARSFYQGEMGKIVLVATGFAVIFALNKELVGAAVFIGFCLMIPVQVIVAMFVSKCQNR